MDELGPTPTSMLPLRKWKGHVYEGGIRVPAIVSWPGKIKKGITSDYCYSSIDYLPTICELAGIKNLPEIIDGISIMSVLMNPDSDILAERPLYWHYPHFSNQLGRPAGAVRYGKYKLVELYESGKLELYNLEEDISESDNLSEQMPGKTDEMHKMLVNWRSSVNAQMPLPNPDYRIK
jgi:arylsulfatase A-like enzyme